MDLRPGLDRSLHDHGRRGLAGLASAAASRASGSALSLFLVQLLFNALWSPLFFGLHRPGLAFVDLMLLWLTLLATVVAFWKAQRLAGAMLLPYLAWVTFAGALNFAIWRLNPS